MSCVLSEVPAISLPVCTAWPVISGVEIFTVGRLVGGGKWVGCALCNGCEFKSRIGLF